MYTTILHDEMYVSLLVVLAGAHQKRNVFHVENTTSSCYRCVNIARDMDPINYMEAISKLF